MDPQLDARVTRVLRSLEAPDELMTLSALDVVLERSHSRNVARRRWMPLVAAAVAALLVAAALTLLPTADETPQPAPSPAPTLRSGPLGTWARGVEKVTDPTWKGTWTISLRSDGVLVATAPSGVREALEGIAWHVVGDQFRTDAFVNGACADLVAGRYRWVRTGDRLVLRALDEPCGVRAEVFRGVWRSTRD